MIFKNYQSDFEFYQELRNGQSISAARLSTSKEHLTSTKKPIRRLSSMMRLLKSLLAEDKLKHVVVSAIIAVVLIGCTPTEKVVYVPKVHNVVTTIYAHDTTIVVRIPENYVEVTTLDTQSVLTLPFAESRAVMSGGKLTHSLGTHGELPTSVRIEERIVTVTDSIPYPVDVPVYIEKPLKWWHKSLMWVGGIAILSVAGYIAVKVIRR